MTDSTIRRGPFVLTVTVPDSADEQDLAALCFAIGHIFNLTSLSIGDQGRALGIELGIAFTEGSDGEDWLIGSLTRSQIQ